jgi:hypothetical protein
MATPQLTPAGYLAKTIVPPPGWGPFPGVVDVCSVSDCVNTNFADYIQEWKHNGYWLFDSPDRLREVAKDKGASLDGATLFYYEVYPLHFDGSNWSKFATEASFATEIRMPSAREFLGFDVVTFYAGSSPECSPLSCNSLASEIAVNSHCLFEAFEDAKSSLERGLFQNAEPGPYRIFAVYSVPWAAFPGT